MESNVIQRKNVEFVDGKVFLDDTEILYVIDWDKIDENAESYELVFPKAHHIRLLEYGHPKKDSVYHVFADAKVDISIASLNSALSSLRHFQISANSDVSVALADFAPGDFKSSFMFELQEAEATLHFHLATLASDNDHKEFVVSFKHLAKDTYAEMNNYGVCEDHSRLVFSGIGHILKGSIRSKTHQNARIMVFDPQCQAFANPILKIDENDVEASHAATVGKVNDEHLFYLTSRGLKEEEAKQLITLGYLKPILQYFDDHESQKISACMERRMK